MSKLTNIGLGVTFLVGVLLVTAVYGLFHGYFDHGLFERSGPPQLRDAWQSLRSAPTMRQ
jgi:hypothetical protein